MQPVGDGVLVHSSTQIPHILRTMLALTLGIDEHKVRVVAPDVGGGFGGKIPVTPEEVITTLVARKLGKPAKYTESRSESLMAAHHGRDQIQDITITAKRDGTVTGLDVHLLADMGAYLRLVGPGVPVLGAFMFNAIYKFPAYRFVCDGIFTTKTPTDAYRGAGRPEATFAIERIMDELAVELDMDPMELRRKNWIKHEEFPFTTVCGLTYDTRQLRGRHRQGPRADRLGRAARRAEASAASRNDPVQLGPRHLDVHRDVRPRAVPGARLAGLRRRRLGGGVGPHARHRQGRGRHRRQRPRAGPRDGVRQIVADKLGVALEDVEIIHGDTQSSPKGLDTYGSRSLAVGGIAIVKAAEKVVAKAQEDRRAPARGQRGRPRVQRRLVLGQGLARLVGVDRRGRVRGLHGARPARRRRAEPGLRRRLRPGELLLPARHAPVRASRSTPRPATSKIRKYVCVDDIGTPINPLIIEGQVHGGLAQGIAQALFEEAVYDDDGNLTTGTFVDYTLPSAADLPSFDTDRTETRVHDRTRWASRASARPAPSRPPPR